MPVRSRVRGLLGRVRRRVAGEEPDADSPAVSAPPAPPQPRPRAEAHPIAPPEASAPPRPKPISEEKRRRHKIKAQKGVLKYLEEQGGSASMADMHDYSERRFFVAHQGFSRMMEFFVNEELINFDQAEGVATLTEEGKKYAHEAIRG